MSEPIKHPNYSDSKEGFFVYDCSSMNYAYVYDDMVKSLIK